MHKANIYIGIASYLTYSPKIGKETDVTLLDNRACSGIVMDGFRRRLKLDMNDYGSIQ